MQPTLDPLFDENVPLEELGLGPTPAPQPSRHTPAQLALYQAAATTAAEHTVARDLLALLTPRLNAETYDEGAAFVEALNAKMLAARTAYFTATQAAAAPAKTRQDWERELISLHNLPLVTGKEKYEMKLRLASKPTDEALARWATEFRAEVERRDRHQNPGRYGLVGEAFAVTKLVA